MGNVKQRQTFFAKSEKIGRKSNGDDDIIYYQNGDFKLDSDLDNILYAWEKVYCWKLSNSR